MGLRSWGPTAVLLWDALSTEMGTSAEGWIWCLVVFVHLHTGSKWRTSGFGIYTVRAGGAGSPPSEVTGKHHGATELNTSPHTRGRY